MESEGRRRYSSDPFATSALEGNVWSLTSGLVSDHTPAALFPGKTRYQLCRWLNWPRGWYGRALETLSLLGFDSQTAQPLAAHHTATLSRPSAVLQYKLLTTCLSRKGNSRTDAQSIPRHTRHTAGSLPMSQRSATNPRPETKGIL
jgi:hypothetical protein